jgi:hypothetical protein
MTYTNRGSCFNCGEDAHSEDEIAPGQYVDCCGAIECVRELNRSMEAERDRRAFDAQQDDYGRY